MTMFVAFLVCAFGAIACGACAIDCATPGRTDGGGRPDWPMAAACAGAAALFGWMATGLFGWMATGLLS